MATPTTPSGKEILAKHVEACGGMDAVKDMKSFVLEARVSMPAQGIVGNMVTHHVAPDKMLSKTTIPGLAVIEQGYDGKVAWSVDPMQGARILEGRELEQMRSAENRFGNFEYEKLYDTIETVGAAVFAGQDAWKVRLVTREGAIETIAYYDRTTGLQVGMEATQSTPMGEMAVTSVLTEYEDFGPMKLPTRVVSKIAGMEQVLEVLSLELNPEQVPAIVVPPQVQRLLAARAAQAAGTTAPATETTPAEDSSTDR